MNRLETIITPLFCAYKVVYTVYPRRAPTPTTAAPTSSPLKIFDTVDSSSSRCIRPLFRCDILIFLVSFSIYSSRFIKKISYFCCVFCFQIMIEFFTPFNNILLMEYIATMKFEGELFSPYIIHHFYYDILYVYLENVLRV